jgi:4-hydroxy-tetrahydrodipicolinate synthase
MSVGAVGVISVASNIIPAVVADLVRHYLSGDSAKALEIHLKYYPLFKDLFIEPNPVPAKFALARLGKMSPDVRLPLCEMAHANVQRLTETLSRLGL